MIELHVFGAEWCSMCPMAIAQGQTFVAILKERQPDLTATVVYHDVDKDGAARIVVNNSGVTSLPFVCLRIEGETLWQGGALNAHQYLKRVEDHYAH